MDIAAAINDMVIMIKKKKKNFLPSSRDTIVQAEITHGT